MSVRGVFDRLDQAYLSGMVKKAKRGDSNDFAELFASVGNRQLYYLERMFCSREKAVRTMPDVFVAVYRGLPSLAREDLFMPWICRISALIYMEKEGLRELGHAEYDLSQILNLPLAESQIMLMSMQGLSEGEIGDLLNVGRRTVRRFVKAGRRHLARGARGIAASIPAPGAKADPAPGSDAAAGSSAPGLPAGSRAARRKAAVARETAATPGSPRETAATPGSPRETAATPGSPRETAATPGSPRETAATPGSPRGKAGAAVSRGEAAGLTTRETSDILDAVFSACGSESNTVPMETLSSYAVYRKERFTLQRAILALALAVFMMLPLLFVLPGYTVSVEEEGERGLPVYTIEVDSILPVGRVLASIRNHSLPVYEAGAKEFSVEPTRNGNLDISVELVNRQKVSDSFEVEAVDAEGPKLDGSEKLEDGFLLKVSDAGIGVDYRDIYAVSASGNIYYPISADEDGVVFEYPDEAWDVYVPDHIGNTLHLSVKLGT